MKDRVIATLGLVLLATVVLLRFGMAACEVNPVKGLQIVGGLLFALTIVFGYVGIICTFIGANWMKVAAGDKPEQRKAAICLVIGLVFLLLWVIVKLFRIFNGF